jgi:hypothetical protein
MNRRLYASRLTPYNDDYGTCAFVKATFLVDCAETDPEIATEILNLQPSGISKKGRVVKGTFGDRIEPRNIWSLASEGEVHSQDLRRHLDWLLDLLEPVSTAIFTLQEMPDTIMRINCVWWSSVGHGGPCLWPEQMIRIARLNLELDFDIYFFPKEQKMVRPNRRHPRKGSGTHARRHFSNPQSPAHLQRKGARRRIRSGRGLGGRGVPE